MQRYWFEELENTFIVPARSHSLTRSLPILCVLCVALIPLKHGVRYTFVLKILCCWSHICECVCVMLRPRSGSTLHRCFTFVSHFAEAFFDFFNCCCSFFSSVFSHSVFACVRVFVLLGCVFDCLIRFVFPFPRSLTPSLRHCCRRSRRRRVRVLLEQLTSNIPNIVNASLSHDYKSDANKKKEWKSRTRNGRNEAEREKINSITCMTIERWTLSGCCCCYYYLAVCIFVNRHRVNFCSI